LCDLIREAIFVDKGGRLTLPKKFRKAIELKEDGKTAVLIEAYPDLENCKSLIIKRYY